MCIFPTAGDHNNRNLAVHPRQEGWERAWKTQLGPAPSLGPSPGGCSPSSVPSTCDHHKTQLRNAAMDLYSFQFSSALYISKAQGYGRPQSQALY